MTPTANLYGGVGIYISNELEDVTITDYTLTKVCDCHKCDFESLFVNFSFHRKRFTIGGIYRHPGGSIDHFVSSLEHTINKLDKNRTCILAGDININLIDYNHNKVLNYITLLLSNKFSPYITLPTRITEYSATCIDHIFVRTTKADQNLEVNSGLFYCDISDHLPGFLSIKLKKYNHGKERPMVRLFGDQNCERFAEAMSSYRWDDLYTSSGDWYTLFISKVKSLFERSFPLVKLSRKRSHDKPWITKAVKVSIQHNHRLYRKMITKATKYNQSAYKRYNILLKNCIKKARVHYYNG